MKLHHSFYIVILLLVIAAWFSIGPFLQLTFNSYVRSFPLGICMTTGLSSDIIKHYDTSTAIIYNATVKDVHDEFLTNFTVKFPAKNRFMMVTTRETIQDWIVEFQKKDTKCHYNVDDQEAYPVPVSVFNSGSLILLIMSIIFASMALVLMVLIY